MVFFDLTFFIFYSKWMKERNSNVNKIKLITIINKVFLLKEEHKNVIYLYPPVFVTTTFVHYILSYLIEGFID